METVLFASSVAGDLASQTTCGAKLSIAFHAGSPDGTGGSKNFYVLSDGISLTGAFAAVTSIDLLDPDEQKGGAVTPSDLLARVRQRPFRLVLTEGAVHEVRHLELVLVTLNRLDLGKPADGKPGVAEQVEIVSLDQVVKVLPLEAAAPAPGNGTES
jgi:hypothetical protein